MPRLLRRMGQNIPASQEFIPQLSAYSSEKKEMTSTFFNSTPHLKWNWQMIQSHGLSRSPPAFCDILSTRKKLRSILSHTISVHIFKSYFIKSHFNIILSSTTWSSKNTLSKSHLGQYTALVPSIPTTIIKRVSNPRPGRLCYAARGHLWIIHICIWIYIYIYIYIKVKVKFTLEQATKAQRGSRGIALLFL